MQRRKDTIDVPLIETKQFQALCDLAAGDDGFMESVIDAFLQQLDQVPEEVREALAGDDADGVSRVAHTLKGSAANVGAQDVSEVCRHLEKTAREGDLAAARTLAQDLVEVIRETRKVYEAEKARFT